MQISNKIPYFFSELLYKNVHCLLDHIQRLTNDSVDSELGSGRQLDPGINFHRYLEHLTCR